jgi:hypothetical protein
MMHGIWSRRHARLLGREVLNPLGHIVNRNGTAKLPKIGTYGASQGCRRDTRNAGHGYPLAGKSSVCSQVPRVLMFHPVPPSGQELQKPVFAE